MDNEWISFEAIAGKAEMKEGVFCVPEQFSKVKKGKKKSVYFKPDCAYLVDHQNRLILKTDMLSRDVRQLPEDFENVILDGAPIQRLPEGSTGLWFHINTHGMKKEAEKYFSEFIKDKKRVEQIQNVCGSEVFLNEYSRTYMYEADKPKVRYHCNINSLIKSYRNVLNIQNVAFRVFGTVRYTLEMMYVVLICPHECEELDNEKFPIMRIGEFYDVIRIIKNGDGGSEEGAVGGASDRIEFAGKSDTYKLEWKPYSTRAQSSNIWDHVAFLFYMPSNSQNKSLPLLPPYKYQTVTSDKKRLFGNIVEVPGPLLTPPPSPSLSSSSLSIPSSSSSENEMFSQLQNEVKQMRKQMGKQVRKVEEELREFRLDTQEQLFHLVDLLTALTIKNAKEENESDEDHKIQIKEGKVSTRERNLKSQEGKPAAEAEKPPAKERKDIPAFKEENSLTEEGNLKAQKGMSAAEGGEHLQTKEVKPIIKKEKPRKGEKTTKEENLIAQEGKSTDEGGKLQVKEEKDFAAQATPTEEKSDVEKSTSLEVAPQGLVPTETEIIVREESRKLARLYFGEDVLRESCLEGVVRNKLDEHVMDNIEEEVKKKFGKLNGVNVKQECRRAIGQLCNNLQKKRF